MVRRNTPAVNTGGGGVVGGVGTGYGGVVGGVGKAKQYEGWYRLWRNCQGLVGVGAEGGRHRSGRGVAVFLACVCVCMRMGVCVRSCWCMWFTP